MDGRKLVSHVPRLLTALLGLWLVMAPLLWQHTSAQRFNAWFVGVLIVVFSLGGALRDWLRFAVSAFAVWLVFSILVLPPANDATWWNNAIVGLLALLLSFVPDRAAEGPRVDHDGFPLPRPA